MEEKTIIGDVDVSFPGTGKGILEITENEIVLYKKKGLFSAQSLVRRLPMAGISALEVSPDHKLRIEGSNEKDEVFVETITFEYKSEAEKVIKHLQDYLEEKTKKARAEQEAREAQEKERESRDKAEKHRQYVHANLFCLRSITRNLFALCTAIPQEEWPRIKEISAGLQKDVEQFVKLNGIDQETTLANFQELAEKEELPELEKGAASLLEFVSGLMEKDAPEGSPSPVDAAAVPKWEDLKYFFLYVSLLGEINMLVELDEPGELLQVAPRLEMISHIMHETFGLAGDRSLATALKLPRKHEEAAAIVRKLTAETDVYLKQAAEVKS
ncbi:MAG: hypothetical protein HY673_19150 [Chloroflexi bacterium]|nr:hypothetical protein [Chloroflexota bacterium]